MNVPFQKRLSLTWLANAPNASNFDLVVPKGKRLVIHQVSGIAQMPEGVKPTTVFVQTSVGPSNQAADLASLVVIPQFVGRDDRPI